LGVESQKKGGNHFRTAQILKYFKVLVENSHAEMLCLQVADGAKVAGASRIIGVEKSPSKSELSLFFIPFL
jgi:hypothetical protein